jgi:hypothetical protein
LAFCPSDRRTHKTIEYPFKSTAIFTLIMCISPGGQDTNEGLRATNSLAEELCATLTGANRSIDQAWPSQTPQETRHRRSVGRVAAPSKRLKRCYCTRKGQRRLFAVGTDWAGCLPGLCQDLVTSDGEGIQVLSSSSMFARYSSSRPLLPEDGEQGPRHNMCFDEVRTRLNCNVLRILNLYLIGQISLSAKGFVAWYGQVGRTQIRRPSLTTGTTQLVGSDFREWRARRARVPQGLLGPPSLATCLPGCPKVGQPRHGTCVTGQEAFRYRGGDRNGTRRTTPPPQK